MLRSKLQNTILLVFSLVISIYLAEAILRYFFVLPQQLALYYPLGIRMANSQIVIKQKEFTIHYRYNANGFRDKCIPRDKKKNEFRILFVGDSLVEGFGVEEQQRFSDILIEKLNNSADGKKITGINIAQLATNPPSYLDNITRFGIALKPDIVVVGIFIGNDFQGGRGMAPIVGTPLANDKLELFNSRPDKGFLFLTYFQSAVYQLFNKQGVLIRKVEGGEFWSLFFNADINKKLLATALKLEEKEIDGLIQLVPRELVVDALNGRVNPGYLLQTLRMLIGEEDIASDEPYYNEADILNTLQTVGAIDDVLQQRGIGLVVVVIPSLFEVHPPIANQILRQYLGYDKIPKQVNEQARLHKELVSYLKSKKINYYDATKDLMSPSQQTFYIYDQHMNKLGHEKVAKGLYKFLTEMPGLKTPQHEPSQ